MPFKVLRKCQGIFDCLGYEMLLITWHLTGCGNAILHNSIDQRSAAPSWLPQALFAPYFSSICADFNVDMLSYFPLVLCVGVFGCLRLNILSH